MPRVPDTDELCTLAAMSFNWDFRALADRLGEVVTAAETELRLEQAVYGLDARDERSLQAMIAERLSAWYGVAREVHYPSSKGNKLTHRMRCDLVLTPPGKALHVDPTKAAIDEAARAKARAVREREHAKRKAAKEHAKQERAAARAAAKAVREAEKQAKKQARLAKKAGVGPTLFEAEDAAGRGVAAEPIDLPEIASPPHMDEAAPPSAGTNVLQIPSLILPRIAAGGHEEIPQISMIAEDPTIPGTIADPAEALWLEVKVAYQFREGGVRHGGYGAQWRQAVVTDLKKIEADPLIHEAGLVLIVFNESDAVLAKDLELFEDVLARKEVLAGFRQVRSVKILDRIGHAICTVAVWPTVQR